MSGKTLLCALLVSLNLIPLAAQELDHYLTFDQDGFTFRETINNEVTIQAFDTTQIHAVIPDTVRHLNRTYEVTSIDDNALIKTGRYLKTLFICKNIRNEYLSDFSHCKNLERIDVDSASMRYSSLDGVLYDKEKTQLIKYPAHKKNFAFSIPPTVASIAAYAFTMCKYIGNVIIPNSVLSIGQSAFWGDSMLVSVKLPNVLRKLENNTFENCISLKTVVIPASVNELGRGVFFGCKNLTSVQLPDSLLWFGIGVFNGCTNLTTINKIPKTITNIPNYLFYNCVQLKSVELPNTVTSIGAYAFAFCDALTNVSMPSALTRIDKFAFYRCTHLTKMQLPPNVKSIGTSAFHFCVYLSDITLPNSINRIDSLAFGSCTSLETVKLPKSLKKISALTFYRCVELYAVVIPASIETIERNAFIECRNLRTLVVEHSSPIKLSYSVFQNALLEQCTLYVPNHSIVTYKLSNNWNAFSKIDKIPANHNSILTKESPFYDKNKQQPTFKIKNITYHQTSATTASIHKWEPEMIPAGKASPTVHVVLSEIVFLKEKKLTVTEIEPFAFQANNQITGIEIPKTVLKIEDRFTNCSKLKSIQVALENPNYSSVNGVLYNKERTTLYRYPKGMSATIYTVPTSTNMLASHAFDGCVNLKSIILPKTMQYIDMYTFSNCINLQSINLPQSIGYIGANAFNNCKIPTQTH